MFSRNPQFYSTPLSSRDHGLHDRQSNSSGAGRKNHDVTLHQNTKQSEEMAQLRTENENLQRELESMKENINLNSQVTAVGPATREFHQMCLLVSYTLLLGVLITWAYLITFIPPI